MNATWFDAMIEKINNATNSEYSGLIKSIKEKRSALEAEIIAAELKEKECEKAGDAVGGFTQHSIIAEKKEELKLLKQYEEKVEYIPPMEKETYLVLREEIANHFSKELKEKYDSLLSLLESGANLVAEIDKILEEERDVNIHLETKGDQFENRFRGFFNCVYHNRLDDVSDVFTDVSIRSIRSSLNNEIERLGAK